MIKKVLFVCKHNRFRSKIAEAIFNRLNKNRNYKVKSAGIIRGRYPLEKNAISIAKKLNIKLKGKPRGISTELLIWADIIVIVADNVPISIFKETTKYGKKIIVWKIKDVNAKNKKEIEKRIKLIERKVKKFIKNLR